MAKSGPKGPRDGGEDARARLVDATIKVLARDGFSNASARSIATEANGVNGLIFYHFGSMEQLLMATARTLSARRIDRVRAGLGGDHANVEWPTRLGDLIRAEAVSDEGRAVVELLVGARTSTALANEVRAAIDAAIEFAAREIERVVGDSPLAHFAPPTLIAELATAAFLGFEVLTQSGRVLDIDRIATTTSGVMQLVTSLLKASTASGR